MSKISEATQVALSYLLTKQTFFAHLLYDQMELVETDTIETPGGSEENPTAATDGKTLWINPEWFAELRPPERAFVLAHEVMHAVFLHMPRGKLYAQLNRGPDGKPFDPEKWNDAGDYVINAQLKAGQVGEMPSGKNQGLYDSKYSGNELIDQVYRDLPSPPPQGGKGGGSQSSGQGQGQQQGNSNGFDKHIQPKEFASKGDEANMERAVKQAAAAAKAQGNLPANMQELIDELLEPVVPWREMLRTEMQINSNADENNWNKPNRRRMVSDTPIILPTQSGVSSGELMIEIDTSGSVSNAEIKSMLTEVKSICDETFPEHVTILWVDAAVQQVDHIETPEDFDDVIDRCQTEGVPGRGGTDMCAAFEWADEQMLVPDHAIVFTDGYTPFPDENNVPYPVTWAMTTKDVQAPFGTTIYVDPDSHDV